MHILIVHIQVKPECVDDFIKISTENARSSRQEPGIARFDFMQQQDDPTRFVLYEVYRTPDDPAKHKETAHYAAWVEKATAMMAEPRTRAFYTNIYPTDENWG